MQAALTNLPGVTNVNVNRQTATVNVESGKVSTADLTGAVEGAGFGAKAAN